MFDSLSAPNSLKNHIFFMVLVWRNQKRDRLTDRFFGRIAKQSLCAFVPTCNDAVEVLAYDCVITGIDDGREPPKPLFGFA